MREIDNILTPAKHPCRTASRSPSSEFWWIFQLQRSTNPLAPLTSSFHSSPLPICASSSAYPESSPFSSLPPISSFPLSLFYSQAKTFLLIRESAEWNHRGVRSVLTLFIFLLPPYALLRSGNEVELRVRRDRVYVCCLERMCLCV